MKEEHFNCQFCHSKFKTEDRYLKHRCKQMERDEEFRTLIGQSAWQYYQLWMKTYHRMVPSSESFLKSKYYRSFVKFSKQVKRLHIPDVKVFIELMKDKDINPTIWTNDQVYGLYLEYLDRRATPVKQAEITIKTLFSVADAAECEVDQVFSYIQPNEMIQLFRERRVSPWLLLFSSKFKSMLQNDTTTEQRIIIESIIRPQYWSGKFADRPKDVELMKKYVKELNI